MTFEDDEIPVQGSEISGDDLLGVVANYATACHAGDVLWALRAMRELGDLATAHFCARLEEADVLGYDWEQIGALFGLDALSAFCQLSQIGYGPPPPSGHPGR